MANLTGWVTGLKPRFLQYRDRIYAMNGANRMQVYDGVNWRMAGIAKDAFTPTSTPAAGALTGTFTWYVVAVNSKHTTKGRPKVAIPSGYVTATLASQQTVIGGIPATHSDPQVDKWYLYRSRANRTTTEATQEEQEECFYYVGSIAIGATSFASDNTADTALVGQEPIRFDRQLPATYHYGCICGERMWGVVFHRISAGTATVNGDTTKIDFSGVVIPDGVVGAWFQVTGQAKRYMIIARTTSQITLAEAFVGALAAGTYSIYRDPWQLYASEYGDVEAAGKEGEGFRYSMDLPDRGAATGVANLNGQLLIFTASSIYVITRQAQDWPSIPNPRLAVDYLGAVSGAAIRVVKERVYFLSLRGPAMWDGEHAPIVLEQVGVNWLDALAPEQLEKACVDYSPVLDAVKFAVPLAGQTENGYVFVWDLATQTCWPETFKHPSCYLSDRDSTGKPVLFFSSDDMLVQDDTGTSDMALGTTKNGTVTAGSTSTTLVDSAATFYTTGRGLKEVYVHIYRNRVWKASRRIESNTGTVLTWLASGAGGGTGFTPAVGDTYEIGAIRMRWRTKDWEIPARAAKKYKLHVGFNAIAAASVFIKTDLVNAVEKTTTPTHFPADLVEKPFDVGVNGNLYGARIEYCKTDGAVGIRRLDLEMEPGEKEDG